MKFDKENFEGIDINMEVLNKCEELGLKVKKANVTKIPYPDKSFDGVNCQQVIEHLTPDEAFKMLNEIVRVLKPDGKIVISTEMATKRFWNTFSHIKPYPPKAIKKIINQGGQETFEKISNIKIEGIYYTGRPFKNGLLALISTLIAHYTGIGRINYTMILKKNE